MATNPAGLRAGVVEVKNFEELEQLGKDAIEGKIVFYNRPMQPDLINTFEAYGGCVNQRYSGAREAAKYGAVGVIVRSMNLRDDDYPHTGAMSYGDLPVSERIPSAAISTNDANLLSSMLSLQPDLQFISSRAVSSFRMYNRITLLQKSKVRNFQMRSLWLGDIWIPGTLEMAHTMMGREWYNPWRCLGL